MAKYFLFVGKIIINPNFDPNCKLTANPRAKRPNWLPKRPLQFDCPKPCCNNKFWISEQFRALISSSIANLFWTHRSRFNHRKWCKKIRRVYSTLSTPPPPPNHHQHCDTIAPGVCTHEKGPKINYNGSQFVHSYQQKENKRR